MVMLIRYNRRCIFQTVAMLLGLLGCGATVTSAETVHGVFHCVLVDDGQDHIFPSVIRAKDFFETPLATWYLYSSPHAGADIRLYIADAITGPWKLHGTVVNEAIGQSFHVSSPHAVWNDAAGVLFLYVHAPNTKTIYCTSKDGVHFEYGGVCVTSKMLSPIVGFESKSASYARVYKHQLPEYGNTWTMTLTASGSAGKDGLKPNAIALCTSDDGMTWIPRRTIVDDSDVGRKYKSLDACWLPWKGRNLMVHAKRLRDDETRSQTEPVDLYVSLGDANWRNWQPLGIFYNPMREAPDDWSARGACFIEIDGTPWMLYEAGDKGGAKIAILKVEDGTALPRSND